MCSLYSQDRQVQLEHLGQDFDGRWIIFYDQGSRMHNHYQEGSARSRAIVTACNVESCISASGFDVGPISPKELGMAASTIQGV